MNKVGVILLDNENYDWIYDFKLMYKWDKNWLFYMVIGNVFGSKNIDEC